jgi:hypothetical protein
VEEATAAARGKGVHGGCVEVEDEVVDDVDDGQVAAGVNEDEEEEDEIAEELLGKDWRRGRWGGAGRGVRAACRPAASSRSRGDVEHSDDDEEGRGGVDHGRHGISSGGPSLKVTRFLIIACCFSIPSSGCLRFFFSADLQAVASPLVAYLSRHKTIDCLSAAMMSLH